MRAGQDQLWRRHDGKRRGIGAAKQIHRQARIVEPNHLTRTQGHPDARRCIVRVSPGVLPHDRVHRATVAFGREEGDNALPANIGEYRLIRSDGTEIGRILVRVSKAGERAEGANRGEESGTGDLDH